MSQTIFRGLRQFLNQYPRLKWTASAFVWLPSGIVFTKNFYTVKQISGRSMTPTLNPDESLWQDVAVFDRTVQALRSLKRGDIIAFKSPFDPEYLMVKRVVALAGDTVMTLPPYPDHEVIVPEGHLWVEGDEFFHSGDSNRLGPIPIGLVNAKLTWILFPPSRYGPIQEPSMPDPSERYGPAWRRKMDAVTRERKRMERVTQASP